MENPNKGVSSKDSSSSSEKSISSLNLSKLPKPFPTDQQIISEKSSQTSKASETVNQKLQEEALQKECNDQKFLHDTLNFINHIASEAEILRKEIENFSGTNVDGKDYLYLDEMLIRATVALDGIDTRGNPLVRQERKRAVQYIQKLMYILDSRLKENKRNVKYYRKPDYSDASDGSDDSV